MAVTSILIFVAFAVFLVLGSPISFSMMLASLVTIAYEGRFTMQLMPQQIYTGMNSFALLAIPLFILAGEIMTQGGLTKNLIKFSNLLVGHITGGLAHVNILTSMLFAGLSGSAVADTAGLGTILVPAMTEEGYETDFSAAITAASSIVGPIIPPSITMVIYALTAGTSVAALFLAGIIPGILIGFSLMVLVYFQAKKREYPKNATRASGTEILKALGTVAPAMGAPIIVVGGVLGGVFTATEAAAVAVAYALLITLIFYRNLNLERFFGLVERTMINTGTVLLIIGVSRLFVWILSVQRVPQAIGNVILGLTDSPWVFLLIANVVLIIIGSFIETAAAITLIVPILLPIAQALGIDLVHFGFIVVLNLVVGMATPPIGVCLFVACGVSKLRIEQISRAIWPYILCAIAILLLVTYVPELALFVPRLFGFVH